MKTLNASILSSGKSSAVTKWHSGMGGSLLPRGADLSFAASILSEIYDLTAEEQTITLSKIREVEAIAYKYLSNKGGKQIFAEIDTDLAFITI